jgi:hypothetical protein
MIPSSLTAAISILVVVSACYCDGTAPAALRILNAEWG